MLRSSLYILPFFVIIFTVTCHKTTIKKSEKDTGSTLEMNTGDTLEIVLEANPTTGYKWEVASVDSSVLSKTGSEYKADVVPKGIVGSGGKSIHRFEATKIGKTFLKLIYRRPFEKNGAPVKTFEITVEVKR
jgi:inhibitor of cysteine peptidase